MAVRRPLYNDGGNLREMTAAMITAIQNRCVYAHGSNPSVTLNVVGSSGTLGSMSDTRMQAGSSTTDVTNFDTAGETPNVSQVTPIVFDKISQVNASLSAPTDTANKLYPVYYDGSGSVQAMTATDMFDTFITQAIDSLIDGTDRDGTFRIHTATSLSDHTLISSTPVFTDTRANAAAYTAGGIPETRDQPTTITNYYLFRTNQGSAPTITQPMLIDGNNDLQVYPLSSFDAMLLAEIRHHTVNTSSSRITYSINGTGNNKGTGMVDTRLDGSTYQQRFVNANDYRTQEFPSGSPQTINTYFLKITRS
tara:strand:- start:3008 stop:3931 length:924 start_codon:yes stop_codon:yes gene_type:complete